MKAVKLLGGVALLAVFAFSMASCDSGFGGEGGTDSRLNGTWVLLSSQAYLLIFNNGNCEAIEEGVRKVKATYTTTGGSLTLTPTHFYGGFLNLYEGIRFTPDKWYSRDELRAHGISEYELVDMFRYETAAYSISGSTLYITDAGGTVVYTKR
jgi:hypothetical protein